MWTQVLATADSTKTGTVEIIATDQTGAVTGASQMATTPLNPPFVQGPREQFLIHCEIEGQGMIASVGGLIKSEL
jgi:hypothetical protein